MSTSPSIASTAGTGPSYLEHLSTQYELTAALQRSSRLNEQSFTALPRAGRFTPHPVTSTGTPTAQVSSINEYGTEATITRRDLRETLETRVSERFFGSEPVSTTLVDLVLCAAQAHDAKTWAEEHRAGLPLDLVIAAVNVAGLAPGIYRRQPEGFQLICPLHEPLDDLVLQLEFASAPVILLAIAPLADELQRWSDHGERVANLRAGGAIGAGMLEAQRYGLAASPFAGFLAAPFRKLVTADGYHNAPLFAGAFGHR